MNSVQESKNELEAAIRYAENAISSAQSTIESMQFRQDMAKKEYQERTGREQALEESNNQLVDELVRIKNDKAVVEREVFDLEREVANLKESLKIETAALDRLREDTPTMPVIPKDVAIAIFREGVRSGIVDAISELEGQSINIDENEYCGDFSVSFEREISLDEYMDFDWMRDKAGDYDEGRAVRELKGLCSKSGFECRIHGIDDAD